MLSDRFNRRIAYLRISVTDRCNLRCAYCMPEEGIPVIANKKVMSFEEIADVVREAVSLGISKIRLTGGEPLVRRGIVELVAIIAAIDGIEDLAMTTNGTLLSGFAPDLRRAGLQRVNISLDTIDPKRYRALTRGGSLDDVLEGIFTARAAGLLPVKLNVVIPPDGDTTEGEAVSVFGRKHGFPVRYIHQMDLRTGEFSVVEGGEGGNCPLCNRLRLSSSGMVLPCLFSDLGCDVRTHGAREAILMAVDNKPARGIASRSNTFYGIGG